MKALVLSGGLGTSIRPISHSITKQLIPVGNEPILFRILEDVTEAGIGDVGVVVSNTWSQQVEFEIRQSKYKKYVTNFITQEAPSGLAHAVLISQNYLGSSPFLMVLGDNVYSYKTDQFVTKFHDVQPDALILLGRVQNPKRYGIASIDDEMRILRVVEKPDYAMGNLALAGAYIFSAKVHDAIKQIAPSNRGELEITDAIQRMIEMGLDVRGHLPEDLWWCDTGSKEGLLKANEFVLNLIRPIDKSLMDTHNVISGNVEISAGCDINRSRIIGPVSLEHGCSISDSVIGPFVSVGSESKISDTNISRSLIMNNVDLQMYGHITESVIGRRTKIRKNNNSRLSSALSLFLGCDSNVAL